MFTRLLYATTKFKHRSIRLKGRSFRMDIADTLARGAVGLMYRKKMQANEGMLFLFPIEHTWKIWMLNMRFPLDVIWLDKNKRVIHIAKDLRPCKSIFNCKSHAPRKPAKYAIELNAGTVAKLRLKENDKVSF